MARNKVLDEKHGIDILGSDGRPTKVLTGDSVYAPWYIRRETTFYYTSTDGWVRAEYPTWEGAFNHVARSRKMLQSHMPGSLSESEKLDWEEAYGAIN